MQNLTLSALGGKKLLRFTIFLLLLLASLFFSNNAQAATCQEQCTAKNLGTGLCTPTTTRCSDNYTDTGTHCDDADHHCCCAPAPAVTSTPATDAPTTTPVQPATPGTPPALDPTYGLAAAAGIAKANNITSIPLLLGKFAGAGLALAGSIFLFLIIYGGILILTSAGDSTRVDKGKKAIIWAIIGAIIIGSAIAITELVFKALV